MAPNAENSQISFPRLKHPIYRESLPKIPQQWLRSKQIQDGAEGLWRIHDDLYDLTDFVNIHPGGTQWIDFTKGTDVTEAFETHHLTGAAEALLPKYFVRKATAPRNYPYTFKEDGFYRTLKHKIMEKLKEIPADESKKSNTVTDSLLLALFILSPLCCWLSTQSTTLGAALVFVNGFIMSSLTVCAHNYCHRRDSWRMYLMNLGGLNYSDWRISHNLSHHMHTNTVQDLELSMLEPMLQFLPSRSKPIWAQMGAFYWPIIFPFITIGILIRDIVTKLLKFEGKKTDWPTFIAFILPLWMWMTSGDNITLVLLVWLGTMLVSSFFFILEGLTAGHHAHINFFDGDIPRDQNLDWGLHQMDTMVERLETAGNHFRSLISFGDHVLHHLFPTLDHAILGHLYPILMEHCEKFETQFRSTNFVGAVLSHNKQLMRKHPNNFSLNKK